MPTHQYKTRDTAVRYRDDGPDHRQLWAGPAATGPADVDPDYSYAIACSTFVRAARIAGSTAARTPTTPASTRYVTSCVHGKASSVMPWSRSARTTAVPSPVPTTRP